MNTLNQAVWVISSLLLSGCLTSADLPQPSLNESSDLDPNPQTRSTDTPAEIDDWPVGTTHGWDLTHVQSLAPVLLQMQRNPQTGCYQTSLWQRPSNTWLQISAQWPTPLPESQVWVNQGGVSVSGNWIQHAVPCLKHDSGALRWYWRNAEDEQMPAVGWSSWFQLTDMEGQPYSQHPALLGLTGQWASGSQSMNIQTTARDEAYVLNQKPPHFRTLQEFVHSPRTCWQSLCWWFGPWQPHNLQHLTEQATVSFEWVNGQGQILRNGVGQAVRREVAGATVVHVEQTPEWVQQSSEVWRQPAGLHPAWGELNGELWSGYHWPASQVASPLSSLFNAVAVQSVATDLHWGSTP